MNIINQSFITNGAILARGDLDGKLNKYRALLKLIEKASIDEERERNKIFAAQMFLGFCYEAILSFLGSKSRARELCENLPIFNFLRHCRNASFHNNRIFFEPQTKRNFWNADWNGKVIAVSDEGKILIPEILKANEVSTLIEDTLRITRI